MDLRQNLIEAIQATLVDLGVDVKNPVQLERPANLDHGDWSTNAALVCAKSVARSSLDLAADLADRLGTNPPVHVEAVEVAGPGFVNFRLADTWLHQILRDVVVAGEEDWARHHLGTGRSLIVEFVSANPTGPLHAGHGRGACYGDSLARLYERCGYKTEREFYVNDRGVQMQLYGASLAASAVEKEIPEGGYNGGYIADWAAEMPNEVDPVEWGCARALRDHSQVLESLNIRFDRWFSESSMVSSGAIDATLRDLRLAEAVYEEDGAVWLRSRDHGDDKDRVLVKSDGEFTYLLPDVAYHRDKFSRTDSLVNVWGADHHGYVARMHAAMRALGHDPLELGIVITQMVNLQRGGEEVRLSKRTGDIVELAEVVTEVGADAARFTYLLQSVDSPQTFDLELVASRVNENPVFYVQYAHARINSIFRKAIEVGVERPLLSETDLSLLEHPRELCLLRDLDELPDTVLRAMRERAPHQIATWVRGLAADFHGFYHDCRVISDDVDIGITFARIWLVEAVRIGLAVALDLLGVNAPEEMRRIDSEDLGG